MNQIAHPLIKWYHQNKRALPWRNTDDPYKIWVSEIILQQTRVIQGLDYYNRFIVRFPDVQKLADASEDEVLKYWQGLGYYSRARNLHKASKQIVTKFGGIFPQNYLDVLSLSGVGDYTASAICSFAYNAPYAVVDGNVYRVLSRLFAIDTPIDSVQGKRFFKQLAQEIIDKDNPGLFNQAIMEFGALQCIPVNPICEQCVFEHICIAFASKKIPSYPVKSLKSKIRKRHFIYLYIRYKDKTYLQKRTGNDIWKNLYEFPLIEMDKPVDQKTIFQHPLFKEITDGNNMHIGIRKITSPIKHVLSHQQILAQCILIEIKQKSTYLNSFVETDINQIKSYPVSRLMELFIENHIG